MRGGFTTAIETLQQLISNGIVNFDEIHYYEYNKTKNQEEVRRSEHPGKSHASELEVARGRGFQYP